MGSGLIRSWVFRILVFSAFFQGSARAQSVTEEFLRASYYQNGHGLIFAMPKAFDLARWLFPSTFGTDGESVLPFQLHRNRVLQGLKPIERLRDQYGLVLLPIESREGASPGVRVAGMLQTRFQNRQVFIAGCASCHSGKAAGRFYAGLGNKTIDPFVMSSDTMKILKAWGSLGVGRNAQAAYENSLEFARLSSDPAISNLSQGLVSTAMIKSWVYRELRMPFPTPDTPRGVVKPPHLWGIAAKRATGFSANGEGRSMDGWIGGLGWMMGAEMAVSGPGASHILENEESLKRMYALVNRIEPPRYPYPIEISRAKAGKILFEQTCIRCHQAHERTASGEPLYFPPKRMPLEKIGTDPARTLSIDQKYRALVEKTEWNRLAPLQEAEPGYLAPQLWGIWARFPYLHNGSVPTLYELLLPPENRTLVFSLRDAGEEHRYDRARMGLTREDPALAKSPRQIRDTRLPEQSNRGHFFGFLERFTEEDRLNLLEYLKTL